MNPTSPTTTEEAHSKRNILIVSSFALVIIVALVVGLILKYSHPQASTSQDHTMTTKNEAQSEYALAQTARQNGDVAQAVVALNKAKLLYAQAKDSSHTKDINSQLSALNAVKTGAPNQAPAATESK